MNFVIDLAHREVSGRASERGIRRSEVRFLMGTQNFFLCPTLATRQKNTSLNNDDISINPQRRSQLHIHIHFRYPSAIFT